MLPRRNVTDARPMWARSPASTIPSPGPPGVTVQLETALSSPQPSAAALRFEGSPSTSVVVTTERRRSSRSVGSAAAGCPIPGRVDPERTSGQLVAVETLDGGGRVGFGRKFNESKAARLAGVPMDRQVNVDDFTGRRKKAGQFFGGGLKTEVAYVDLG